MTKKLKRLLAFMPFALGLCLPTAALAQTDAQYKSALQQIMVGTKYRIYTTSGETKYYLTTSGTLTTEQSGGGEFTFNKKAPAKDYAQPIGFNINNFTNPDGSKTSSSQSGEIKTNSRGSDTWEAQVFYYDDASKLFAVRATNASGSSWGANTFWTVTTDDSNGVKADYNVDNAGKGEFIWGLEKADSYAPAKFGVSNYYVIKNVNSDAKYVFIKSPEDGDTSSLQRTSDETKAAHFLLSAGPTQSSYYAYDLVSGYYIVPATSSNDKSAWTVSLTPAAFTIADASKNIDNWGVTTAYALLTDGGGMANAISGAKTTNVENWTSSADKGSHWTVTEGETANGIYALPTATYVLKNAKGDINYRYMKDSGSQLARTNSTTDADHFVCIPAGDGYYFMYDMTAKKFLTPPTSTDDGSEWTLGTEPAKVYVINDIANNKYSEWGATAPIYILAASATESYANAYDSDKSPYYVKNYTYNTDCGSHWYLDRIADETASVALNGLADATALINATRTSGTTLSYSADLTATAKYGTLVLPFDAELTEDVKAYKLTKVSGNTVYCEEVTSLKADEPVLTEVSANVTLSLSGVPANAEPSSLTSGLLTGVYTSTPATSGSYVLQKHSGDTNTKFYKVSDTTKPTVGAFRASLTATTASSAKAFDFAFDDNATAIEQVENTNSASIVAVYSAEGACLRGLQKGINVVKMSDGTTKKVIIK